MTLDLVGELREQIAAGRVTCIVGAGVSMAATYDPARKPNFASWFGLLEHGIDRCVTVVPSLPKNWAASMQTLLQLGKDGDTDALLNVADQITRKLNDPAPGEFRKWLRETVGSLRLIHSDVPAALGALGVPLFTTNYDDILESVTNLPTLTWQETAEVERVLRGEDRAIVHLHGHWRRPESVVFGSISYKDVIDSKHAQAVLRALRMTKTLLFVGFGAGLDDPNFDTLLRWTREVFKESEIRHFRLARASEVDVQRATHRPEERIFVLSYGEKHEDLAPFLETLAPQKTAKSAPVRVVSPSATLRPRILLAGPFFGVPAAMRADLTKLWHDEPYEKALPLVQAKLRRSEIRHAQIAAIARHDVIIDLSPWRAFSTRWSVGLRDVESEHDGSADVSSVPLVFFAWPNGHKAGLEPAIPAVVEARLRALRANNPKLADRLDALASAGFSLSGFDTTTAKWCSSLLTHWPNALLQSDSDLGAALDKRPVARSSEPLDGPLRDPSLDDYLRALRVVAGQVTLAGDTQPRPIQSVYVEMAIRPADERRKALYVAGGDPGELDSSDHPAALREEIEARRKAMWDLPTGEIIQADAIHTLARRVLLWGPAGTGKSTLLRSLACKSVEEGRIPVWVPRLVDLTAEDFADALATRALQSVGLPEGPTAARIQLREAIERGQAILFLDGFDEAPPATRASLPARIAGMPPDLRVVLASRPLRRIHTGLVEITLAGLPATGAEPMLKKYFGEQNWIRPLLDNLGALPDGMAWLTTPVLLGLAASLYQRNRNLPDATLDLYEAVLRQMLERLPDPHRIRQELHQIARRMLVPEAGEPTVTIHEGSLSYTVREDVLATGLFTGDEWLRFTHLTFGEYLAAGAGLDLVAEREKERTRAEGKTAEETALEVLPMAHALQGVAAIEDVLADARERDTASHRMLRLLLRAIGYGGQGVQTFLKQDALPVLELLAERLQSWAGRFGDLERQLMADAERAASVLRSFLDASMGAHVVRRLQPVLATEGEAGTEAHILMLNLGLQAPERRVSRWWPTIHRQARALVRAGVGVDEIIELTKGVNQFETHLAVEVLGKFADYRDALRPLIEYPWWAVRKAVIGALSIDPSSISRIRERLNDEEGIVRSAAVDALARDPQRRKQYIDRLIECLRDPDLRVRSTAVSHLLNEKEARPRLRQLIRQHIAAYLDDARDNAILGLADDPDSRSAIQEYLEYRNKRHRFSADVLSDLAQRPTWLPLVRKRLNADNPDPDAIKALGKANDVSSWPKIRELLGHSEESVRSAAVTALARDPDSRAQILLRLDDKDENEYVRSACVEVIGLDLTHRTKIRELLDDPSEHVRCTTIDVLGNDESEIELLRKCLTDKKHNTRLHTIRALAKYPDRSRETLWAYFSAIANESDVGEISHGTLRGVVIDALKDDLQSRPRIREALSARHYDVRKAAIKALQNDAAAHDAIRPLLNDPNSSVREAAFKALANERAVRERLLPALDENLWPLRLAGFLLLIRQDSPRQQIRNILQLGRGPARVTAVQPLAYDIDSRPLLYRCINDRDWEVQVTVLSVLRRDPEARRQLRILFQDDESFAKFVNQAFFNNLLDRAVEVLAEDPEAHPLLLERAMTSDDHNDVAAIIPALTHYPKARAFLRELLRNKENMSNVRAAAALALAGDGDSKITLLSLLDDKEDRHLRAAAVEALSDESDVRPRFRTLLSEDRNKEVRKAALDALIPGLGNDDDTRPVLRERLPIEPEDNLRLQILEALEGDPESIPLLRERLRDPSSAVRKAAAKALHTCPVPAAKPLEHIPALRPALHLAGTDPQSLGPLSSLGLRLQDHLEAFVKAPRPLHLDSDPIFAEVLLGWLLARLSWAGPEGQFRDGRVFGETEKPVERLVYWEQPLVVRVAMDSADLPRERNLYPLSNLIEAWRVATHLSTARSVTFFLACADVGFEHLTPPELEPGQVFWGPGFYGFRLRQAEALSPQDPIDLLVSQNARQMWLEAPDEESLRYQETLARLAMAPEVDLWALVPVLSRIGDQLPPSIQEALRQRLPRVTSEAARQLGAAMRRLGGELQIDAPNVASPESQLSDAAPHSPINVGVSLQIAMDEVRKVLIEGAPSDHALKTFEQSLHLLASPDIAEGDRDDAVMLFAGLLERTRDPAQMERMLVIGEQIELLVLSRGARRRLRDLQRKLRIMYNGTSKR